MATTATRSHSLVATALHSHTYGQLQHHQLMPHTTTFTGNVHRCCPSHLVEFLSILSLISIYVHSPYVHGAQRRTSSLGPAADTHVSRKSHISEKVSQPPRSTFTGHRPLATGHITPCLHPFPPPSSNSTAGTVPGTSCTHPVFAASTTPTPLVLFCVVPRLMYLVSDMRASPCMRRHLNAAARVPSDGGPLSCGTACQPPLSPLPTAAPVERPRAPPVPRPVLGDSRGGQNMHAVVELGVPRGTGAGRPGVGTA